MIVPSKRTFPLLLSVFLISCGSASSSSSSKKPIVYEDLDYWYEEENLNDYPGNDKTKVDPETVVLPPYSIHTKVQEAYLLSGITTAQEFAKGNKELSKPNPIILQAETEKEGTHYFEISKYEDFSASEYFTSESSQAEIYNLEVGQKYYYRYSLEYASLKNAETFTFTTASNAPRNLNIDGITNVRDIGGYPSKLGGKIRQGLFYRGGRLNKSTREEVEIQITEKGREELVDRLGVKEEIDLRMDESCTSEQTEYGQMKDGLIEGLHYNRFPIDWHISNQMLGATDVISRIFTFLGDTSHYPVYIHCNIGTDRTGLICFLLESLLGLPYENVFRDYLFSNFGDIEDNPRDYKKLTSAYYKVLISEDGDNMHQKTYNYLLSCGVSEENLDNIIDLFIEPSVKID